MKTKRAMKANLLKGVRHETLNGRDMVVVPVVMIKGGVVMNEILVPPEEVYPIAWNGVPVTLYHPEVATGYTSANSPDIIEQFAVGTIFNSKWEGDSLKGEAWVDVGKAEELKPGLVAALESGEEMDVSTGFFSADQETQGVSKGRVFKSVARQINPDHLALLPGGTGACSWEDGCGVRANERKDPNMSTEGEDKVSVSALAKVFEMLGIKPNAGDGKGLETNRRGDDDDYRQVIADLISNDKSPFVPQDEDSLRMMSYETLLNMRDTYLPGDKSKDDDEEEPKTNQKEADVADDTKGKGLSAEEVKEIVANALKEALPEAIKANAAPPALSAEDKAALDEAKKIVANNRTAMVTKIKANTKLTDEQLATFTEQQLADLAGSLNEPAADYSGVAFGGNFNEAADDDVALKAMTADHVGDTLKQFSTNGKAN